MLRSFSLWLVPFSVSGNMTDTTEKEVLANIGDLTLEQLLVVHTDLGLPAIDDAKKVEAHVLKVILRYLNSEEVEDSDDGGLAHFLRIRTYMDTLGVVKSEPGVAPAIAQHAVGINVTAATSGPSLQNVSTTATTASRTSTSLTTSLPSSVTTPATTDLATLKKVLRKDWKLKGTIGLPGEKDKLTFSGLAYQINNAEKKGYAEEDICEEVIKATSDEVLRSYLEGKEDLTLAKLRKLLRAHFQEKDPTTLFNTLSNSYQKIDVTASYFVMQMLDLRTKILFATKEVDSRVDFSESLVQNQFIRTVTTGLRNDNIRNEIKPLLLTNMPDEDFLPLLNRAERDEMERLAKLEGEKPSVASVSSVQPGDPLAKVLDKLNVIEAKVDHNSAEILVIKSGDRSSDDKDDKAKVKKPYKCAQCRENNISNCKHCFKCGSSKHKRPECDQEN